MGDDPASYPTGAGVTQPMVDIRLTELGQGLLVIVMAAWPLICILIFLSQHGWSVIGVLLTPAVEVLCVRMLRTYARTDGDELLVQNIIRTHRLSRHDIAAFETVVTNWGESKSRDIAVILEDGSFIKLDASSNASRGVMDENIAALERWRSEGSDSDTEASG
jgi:hypothetical protein